MGRICSIVGCSSSTYQLDKWYTQLCDVHGLKFGSCVCKPPFTLYPFPIEKKYSESRKRWTRLVNRKNKKGGNWQPTYQDRICSLHFKEKEPTIAWPDPTENLGYDHGKTKPAKSPRSAPKERPQYQEVLEQRRGKRKRKREAAHTVSHPVDEPAGDHDVTDDVSDFSTITEENQSAIKEAVLHDHEYVSHYKEPPSKKKSHSHDHTSSCTSSTKDCKECHKEARILELEEVVRKRDTKCRKWKRCNKKSTCVSYDITNIVLKSDKTVTVQVIRKASAI